MIIREILDQERIACREIAASKKRVLEKISQLLAQDQPGLNPATVFDKLLERERLGSTGLDQGVAIPHCRIQEARSAVIALMTLQQGINFDSRDNRPVDIVFGLIVPEHCTDTHLKILASAAEMFRDQEFCNQLRACSSSQQLYELISYRQPNSLSA